MHFDLVGHTHFLGVSGSRAYGIHIPGKSDVDLKAVVIPPKENYLGFNSWEVCDSAETIRQAYMPFLTDEEKAVSMETKAEGVAYEIRKAIRLTANFNPNMLDIMFGRDEEVRFISPLFQRIRDNRHLFISSRAFHTLTGFARGELGRIKLHHGWMNNPPKPGQDKKYDTWVASRSPERHALEMKIGYDAKNAGHLVRLYRMGYEVLTTGQVHIHRGGIDAEEIKAIRQGAWTYEQIMEWVYEMDIKVKEIYDSKTYVCPENPDEAAIERLMMDIILEAVF